MLVNGENFGVSLNIFPSVDIIPTQSSIKDHTAGLRLTALISEYQGPVEGDDHASSLQRGASPLASTEQKDSLGFKCHFPCFRNPGILIA
uniref:Uncharacterized protein n=1 Tax=Aotus nancymaae TaxID=37293 RepID=A0A2K5CZC3_AOTNA